MSCRHIHVILKLALRSGAWDCLQLLLSFCSCFSSPAASLGSPIHVHVLGSGEHVHVARHIDDTAMVHV